MPRRVLVIDDSATLRAIVHEVLLDAGYDVETAVDGADGLERVQREAFDLVLVDFVMPRLNGYQFAQALRSLPGGAAVPLVLVSAKAEQIGERFCAQTGALGSLAKPFTPTQLLATVQGALGESLDLPEVPSLFLDGDTPSVTPIVASTSMPTVGPPSRGTGPVRLVVSDPEGDTKNGRMSVSTRELRPPLTPRGGIGQVMASAAYQASAGAEPLFAREEAEGFLSWLDDEEEGTREESRSVAEIMAGVPAQRPLSRMSWPPQSGFGVPTVPSLVDVREVAHERFATVLGQAIMPVLVDLAATGGNVSEDTVSQVLRFYLSQNAIAALASELRALDPNLRGPMALEGMLGAVPLGEVFQLLALQSQTGLLVIERGGRSPTPTVTVALRAGRIEQCVATGVGSEFLLGRYLVTLAGVRRDDIESVAHAARARKTLLGNALLNAGHLRPGDLERCLVQQTSELVFEVLRWTTGRFHFEAGATLPEAQAARLGLPSEGLVLEAFRRLDEWRLIGEYLPHERAVFAADRGALVGYGAERLAHDERTVLDAVDGQRSVRDVVKAVAMSSFDTCKILYRLVRARLVVPVAA